MSSFNPETKKVSNIFLVSYIATFLLLLLVTSYYIYKYDPNSIFRYDNYLSNRITDDILMSRGVNIPPLSYDPRTLKRDLLIKKSPNEDIAIVIGSSTSWLVGKNLCKREVLNLSVGSARIEEYIAFSFIAQNHSKSKVYIFGPDATMFDGNKRSKSNRWLSLRQDYYSGIRFFALLNYHSPFLMKLISYKYFLNFSYLMQSIQSSNFIKEIKNKGLSKVSDNFIKNDDHFILNDGSEVFGSRFTDNEKIILEKDYGKNLYKSSEIMKSFMDLILSLQAKGITPIIYLPPYYPNAEFNINEYSNNFLSDIESELRFFANANKITIIGSYNSEKATCAKDEFYDDKHSKPQCVKKIFHTVLICD